MNDAKNGIQPATLVDFRLRACATSAVALDVIRPLSPPDGLEPALPLQSRPQSTAPVHFSVLLADAANH